MSPLMCLCIPVPSRLRLERLALVTSFVWQTESCKGDIVTMLRGSRCESERGPRVPRPLPVLILQAPDLIAVNSTFWSRFPVVTSPVEAFLVTAELCVNPAASAQKLVERESREQVFRGHCGTGSPSVSILPSAGWACNWLQPEEEG